MNARNRTQAVYVISVAAELAGMHPQTLRIYERRGLVQPARTQGGNRRYSDADIETLQRISELAEQGMNLEGIRRVMELEHENAVCATSSPGREPRPRTPTSMPSGASAATSSRCARPWPSSASDRASSIRTDELMTGVPWRRVAVVFTAVALAVSGVFVAFRADGFDAVDATVPRATRWFVDDQLDALVLADGFAGKLLAKVPLDSDSNQLEVVQGPSGASVLDRSGAATSQTIDTAALRVGSAQSLDLVSSPETIVGVGQSGVVAVQPGVDEGVLLPPEGEPLPFEVGDIGRDEATRVSSDGAVWTIADGAFARITTTGREVFATGLGTARFSLAGNTPVLLDADRQRVRFGDGDWVSLSDEVPISDVVVQQPGPPASCGWVGGNDRLWCVGAGGVEERVDIDGLDIDGSDLLAIAGDAGVVVRPGASEIVPIDWRAGEALDAVDARDEVDGANGDDGEDGVGPGPTPDAPAGANFSVASSVDLVWVEDVTGDLVWAINPWGVEVIRKTDAAPLIGESGDVIEDEDEPAADGGTGIGTEGFDEQEPEPDEDGIDEAPEAKDDQVTARFGIAVPIAVTANDFDPDGDAIAVVAVDVVESGTITIQSASTVLYSPKPNTVGTETFDYTITDGAGHEDTATVTVQLLPATRRTRRRSVGPTPARPGSTSRSSWTCSRTTSTLSALAPDRLVHRRRPPRYRQGNQGSERPTSPRSHR